MEKVSMLGLDTAKRVFQVHGSDDRGRKLFSKKLQRGEVLAFFEAQPRTVVALEACGASHHWARKLVLMGHEVKLIPPQKVKPFVQRHKNDAADAEAICEAAVRPNIKPVAHKSEDQQARAVPFRARELLVRVRTALINALRGHCAEFGLVGAKGNVGREKLEELVSEGHADLPQAAREALLVVVDELKSLDGRIERLETGLQQTAKTNPKMKAFATVPGVGTLSAYAFATLGPDAKQFKSGRSYAAWLGLVPLQNSSGGKERLGHITRDGNKTLRQLLILGAGSWISSLTRKRAKQTPPKWLANLLGSKPRMLVIIAVANKLARILWALQVKGGVYKDPAVA